MFNGTPRELVTLLLPNGIADGTLQYREIAGRAIVIWSEYFRPGSPSHTEIGAELLIESPVSPVAGSRIRWRGGNYALGKIRICSNMDGEQVCCRCSILAG